MIQISSKGVKKTSFWTKLASKMASKSVLGVPPRRVREPSRKKDAQVLEKGRPQGRHLDPKIDMFAHFDVIFSMFFRGCFLIDFLMVFW